jgi:hypothetical protein
LAKNIPPNTPYLIKENSLLWALSGFRYVRGMPKMPQEISPKANATAVRETRVAEALRENLKRRKQQQQAREAVQPKDKK